MIALDTNILARVVLNDDPAQYGAALAACSREAIIPPTVMLELIWVLRTLGGLSDHEIQDSLQTLAARPNLTLGSPEGCAAFLHLWANGLDAEDAVHLAFAGEVDTFVTFDRAFAKRARKAKATITVELAG